ncbi:hypothetical protein GCM10027048_20150 [Hymenobacter coalescens]
MNAPPAPAATWPRRFPSPVELLAWLDDQAREHGRDWEEYRFLLAFRWLVLAELDRTAPEPAAKAPFDTPIAPPPA